MNRVSNLQKLHDQCSESLEAWIAEAKRTCKMLGECTEDKPSLQTRMALHDQRSRENDAQAKYMKFRARLFEQLNKGNPQVYGNFPESGE